MNEVSLLRQIIETTAHNRAHQKLGRPYTPAEIDQVVQVAELKVFSCEEARIAAIKKKFISVEGAARRDKRDQQVH